MAVHLERAFGNQIDTALRKQGGALRRVQVTVPDFAAAVFITANSPLLATLPSPVARAPRGSCRWRWGSAAGAVRLGGVDDLAATAGPRSGA